ncbi:hypothetical protein E2562_032301 [Oryza meyeriana var. granulata]|uniref:Uncharacterized protein n=1 Tax=Oryza meyeriana var. granulata TaxID=110450 RepID=A0A6G1ERW0_9ORYZ|nr:hypothetical protein E2562_032301 [Oryza meyeriana var. granulata]
MACGKGEEARSMAAMPRVAGLIARRPKQSAGSVGATAARRVHMGILSNTRRARGRAVRGDDDPDTRGLLNQKKLKHKHGLKVLIHLLALMTVYEMD